MIPEIIAAGTGSQPGALPRRDWWFQGAAWTEERHEDDPAAHVPHTPQTPPRAPAGCNGRRHGRQGCGRQALAGLRDEMRGEELFKHHRPHCCLALYFLWSVGGSSLVSAMASRMAVSACKFFIRW